MSALTDVFSNIANAIRTKTGGSDTYTPYQMPDAITNIPTGGGYDGVLALEINGEYKMGYVPGETQGRGDLYVGSMLAWNAAKPNASGITNIYMGDDVIGEYAMVNGVSTLVSFNYALNRLSYGVYMFDMNHNFAGLNFYMPRNMQRAEYMLGNGSYWSREFLPHFVFPGNTNIMGIFVGIPSWGGFQLNIYHPNIEDYISTDQTNSLFGTLNRPYQGWSPFSWTKRNNDYYYCSEYNVGLLRYTES